MGNAILALKNNKKIDSPRPRIAFPDFEDERVLGAVSRLEHDAILRPVIIRPPLPESDITLFAGRLSERDRTGALSAEEARRTAGDPYYFAALGLAEGRFDGVVAGASRTTADTVRAAFKCVGPAPGSRLVFGLFLMETRPAPPADKGRRLLFADCAVMPEPSSRALAQIGVESARAFRFFTGETPRVAFLSFSTRGSAEHEAVNKVREAAALARKLDPSLAVDGELQADVALVPWIADRKGAGGSPAAGRANVLIFPDLHSGNIGYKIAERLGGCRATGPILWGLAKPMSDLSRGCSVEDVMNAARCVAKMVTEVTTPC